MPGSNSYVQSSYRFRNDDGSETSATWIDAANTAVSISLDTNFRIRIKVSASGMLSWTDVTWNLYYSLNNGAYTAVTASSPVKFSASSNLTDGQDATEQLAYISYYVADNNGVKETTGGATNSSSSVPAAFETEWCLTLDSAQVSSTDTLDFRIYRGTTALNSYTVTPRATASGGSSQSLTLTCAAGSYSLAGVACTLTYTPAAQNLTLSCAAGSYSLTGTDATLQYGKAYSLSCDPASYPDNMTISGSGSANANGLYVYQGVLYGKAYYKKVGTLPVHIIWSADFEQWVITYSVQISDSIGMVSASYYRSLDAVATPDLVTTWETIQGSAPLPTVDETLAPTYLLVSSDIALTKELPLKSYTLTCGSMNFSISQPSDCTLIYTRKTIDYTLALAAGAYSATGSPVTFVVLRNNVISSVPGTYAVTGNATTLTVLRNYVLSCGTSSYSITGTASTFVLLRNYVLNLDAGVYSQTGTALNFTGTKLYSVTLDAGSYTTTGTAITFAIKRTYVVALNAGTYSQTGTAATFAITRYYAIASGAGTYALTGTAATLTALYNRLLALDASIYALTGSDIGFELTRSYLLACDPDSYALSGVSLELLIVYIVLGAVFISPSMCTVSIGGRHISIQPTSGRIKL